MNELASKNLWLGPNLCGWSVFNYEGCNLLWQVFSTDGKGLHFDDMLDMFSVFSVRAPLQLKATYAYKIYDHDKDGIVSREDIKKTLIAITGI